MIPAFKNVGERSTGKITALLVFFLWLVKSENFVNNRIFDLLEKCDLFFDFQQRFRSSRSTGDLLTVVMTELLGLLTDIGLLVP